MLKSAKSLLLFYSFISVFIAAISLAEPFKVGISLPLSGAGAEYGAATKNGILLAQETFPNLRQIKFIFEDNQYDAKLGLSAFNKLRSIDKVDIFFSWGETPSAPVAALADRYKTPLVVLGTDPSLAVGRKYVLLFYNSAEQYALAMLKHLRSVGVRKIAIFKTEDAYGNQLVDALERNLSLDESLIVVASVEPSEVDFRSHLLRLKALEFDIVGNLLFPGQVAQLYVQAAQLGMRFPTFGFDVLASPSEIAAARGGLENAVIAYHSVSADFQRKYLEKFRDDIFLVYACNAYEFARLINELFGSARPTPWTPDEILTSLKLTKARESCMGRYSLVDSPKYGMIFEFPIHIFKIVSSKLVQL